MKYTATALASVLLLVALAISLVLVGCSGQKRKTVYPVRGKVFYHKKPTAGAVVTLHPLDGAEPKNWPGGYPRGRVGPDGTFAVTTYQANDGAPAGRYAILLRWTQFGPEEEEAGEDKLGERYSQPETSPWKIEVKELPGGNDLEPIHIK